MTDYHNRVTPDRVTHLDPGQVFVFGSNVRGIHGAGAALIARKFFGAKLGVGVGRTGHCYALPTKWTPYDKMYLHEVRDGVNGFIDHATVATMDTFLVVEIGCKLAGFNPDQIAPLFRRAVDLTNIWLPARFWAVLSGGG